MSNPLKSKAVLFGLLFVVVLLVLFVLLSPEKKLSLLGEAPPPITQPLLEALREQNTDKPLEYAESQPIIKSMTKYLYQFDALLHQYPQKARAPLIVIERRLIYLQAKGLDVSNAKKILEDQVETYIEN